MDSGRKHEVQQSIDAFEKRASKIGAEVRELHQKRDEHAQKLESIKQRNSAACRLEALSEPNDREQIERELATTSAKLSGMETLLAEKIAERVGLDAERAPVEKEFQALLLAERREQLLAEVEQIFQRCKSDLKDQIRLRLSNMHSIVRLRSKYEEDPFVRRQAQRFAELLANASGGVRMHELFTIQELKELSDFEIAPR